MTDYTFRNGKKLRTGFTTGICAAAAAKAAVTMLLNGELLAEVEIIWRADRGTDPRGDGAEAPEHKTISGQGAGTLKQHIFPLEEAKVTKELACCGVRKDAGDDADVTDGILIMAEARLADWQRPGGIPEALEADFSPADRQEALEVGSGILILGGEGIGRVTLPGLDRPEGEAAINSGPRRMIREAVRAAIHECASEAVQTTQHECASEAASGIIITISAPDGRQIAARTFNPLLGIEGGISILGTTGIVDPMSGAAAEESVRTEVRVRCAQMKQEQMRPERSQDAPVNQDDPVQLVLAPGNTGAAFAEQELDIPRDHMVLCSNYFGAAIDEACLQGVESILLIGALGKMIKLAGGIFNTHSYESDARLDILMRCALQAGADEELLREMDRCITTEAAMAVLKEHELDRKTAGIVCSRALEYVRRRCGRRGDAPDCQMILLSNRGGWIASSEGARV